MTTEEYIKKNFPKAFHEFLIRIEKNDEGPMSRLWMDASQGDSQMYALIDLIRKESKRKNICPTSA